MDNGSTFKWNFLFGFDDFLYIHTLTTIVYTNICCLFIEREGSQANFLLKIYAEVLWGKYLIFGLTKMENNSMDLSQQEWEDQLEKDDNAFILDVRSPEELEEGYIPNAANIDFYLGQDFLSEIQKLDKSKNYYVYCRSGNRSGQAL